jgi:hypothetical protein
MMMVSRMIQITALTPPTRARRISTLREEMTEEMPVSVKVILIAVEEWMPLMWYLSRMTLGEAPSTIHVLTTINVQVTSTAMEEWMLQI